VSDRARLFVGLAPDARTAEELHEAAARVIDAARWRLYAARDLHLTLCFLGEVDRACIEPLTGSLNESCAGFAAPELEIAGLGAFPSAARPRVAWAGARGPEGGLEALHAIERTVVEAVERLGLAHDARGAFVPHLTLARPRGHAALEASADALGRAWPWRPAEVILFESVGSRSADREGPRYVRRSVVRLGAG
jgi:2'-5' RNA ligase